ncbi:MAG: homoserine kinase [Cellvibrionales bacterium]|nr:homoserine kinase [Cellvibrionales bacterium]
MAVFTTLDFDEINALIKPYGIGELIRFSGVSAGLENTNYAITTSSNHMAEEYGYDCEGEYFLTIFEELPENDLPFHLGLLELLGRKHIPVSIPVRDYDGKNIQMVNQKPAVLCPRLEGHHVQNPSLSQCEKMGVMLARIHEVSHAMEYQGGGIRDVEWLNDAFAKVTDTMTSDELAACQQVLDEYNAECVADSLPKTIIHGDLFRDNALFDGDDITGVIDFFTAGRGFMIYDMAVCANDWCVANGALDNDKLASFIKGYESLRALTDAEKAVWPLMLKITALRFWVSRIQAVKRIQSHPHELNTFTSPEPFKQLFFYYVSSEPQNLSI